MKNGSIKLDNAINAICKHFLLDEKQEVIEKLPGLYIQTGQSGIDGLRASLLVASMQNTAMTQGKDALYNHVIGYCVDTQSRVPSVLDTYKERKQ